MKLLILLVFISLSSFAQTGGTKKNGFYLSFAGKGLLGTSGSKDTSVAKTRDQYVYGAETILGYHFGPFLVGGSAEYNVWKQKTDPSSVNDTNMSGTQVNLAPVFGLSLGRVLLIGKMVMSSTMTLDKKNSNGDKTIYSNPSTSSYVAQLNFKLGGHSYLGVEYNNVVYGKSKVQDTTTKLRSDKKSTSGAWGLVYGFSF
jgi:hypothetical protein